MADLLSVKARVTFTADVTICYPQGIIADNEKDADTIISEDMLELGMLESGLIYREHDDTPDCNGYVALVEDYEPTVNWLYHLSTVPVLIKKAIADKTGDLSGVEQMIKRI